MMIKKKILQEFNQLVKHTNNRRNNSLNVDDNYKHSHSDDNC
jgi:hypothetical protein